MKNGAYRLPPITLLVIIIEFAVIILASLNATSQFASADPNLKLPGYEGEWLTNSATFASFSLQKFGYIPLWQPYIGHGEPLIDNPFGFVLNPISTIPSLLYGSNVGVRYSIILSAVLAGLGGWALARNLGFGSLGRILLGMLLAGKGNMIGMVGNGYFQLGVSQAYIPWVLAGTVGILRLKHQRLSVALTAIMFALMFWAGNIYFLLPTLMSMAGLALTHIIRIEVIDRQFRVGIDIAAIRRLLLAGVFVVGLSAITFIPIFLHQSYIGGHPNEAGAGTYADLPTVAGMFFSDSSAPYDSRLVPGGQEFYQTFILPLWFAVAAFIVMPVASWLLVGRRRSDTWKVWIVGAFVIIFCLLWGTGQNPVVAWLYENVPLIGQWRFVGRMLGIVSFWLAVLAVISVDGFWRTLRDVVSWRRWNWAGRFPIIQTTLRALLVILSLAAAYQVMSQWKKYAGPAPYATWPEDTCIVWLRQQNPDAYLSVWTQDYSEITIYLLNQVRHANITADFRALPLPATLFKGDLTQLMPQYGMAWVDNMRSFLAEQGYHPMLESPMADSVNRCVYEKPDAMPYAFTVPLPDLYNYTSTLPVEATTPVSNVVQYPDQIGLSVTASPDSATVVTVQEVAYPGWTVEVDNQPATLESVGGLLGVVVPVGQGQRFVHFVYRSPLLYLGAVITLIFAPLIMLYLVRADRFIPRQWRTRASAVAEQTGKTVFRVLTSPEIFEPRRIDTPLLPPGPSVSRDGDKPEAEDEADKSEVE